MLGTLKNYLVRNFRRAVVVFATVFFWGYATSQAAKTISIPTTTNSRNESDTSLWYTSIRALAKQIGLNDLQNSIDSFHLRFWTSSQAIDVWTTDFSYYSAIITNFAQRYDDKLLRKAVYKIGKVYSNQVSLDSIKAKRLFNMIRHLSIAELPSDHEVKGWGTGFDGEEYLIEVSTTNRYQFKTYWTPRIFTDSLKEAEQIQKFIDFLNHDVMIKDYDKLSLPKGTYRRNGIPGIQIRMRNEWIPGATKVTDLL